MVDVNSLAPLVAPAKYAKNMMAVYCPSDGTGYKTRAMYLACHLPHRYSHREHAYIMSRKAAAQLLKLFAGGYDATVFGELVPPKEV